MARRIRRRRRVVVVGAGRLVGALLSLLLVWLFLVLALSLGGAR